jgi:hypothetical protein
LSTNHRDLDTQCDFHHHWPHSFIKQFPGDTHSQRLSSPTLSGANLGIHGYSWFADYHSLRLKLFFTERLIASGGLALLLYFQKLPFALDKSGAIIKCCY